MNNLQRLIFYLVRLLFAYCILLILYRKTSGSSEFYNTLDHEKLHVLLHISEACNINLDSEEFEYLSGEIAERIYPVSKQFICN